MRFRVEVFDGNEHSRNGSGVSDRVISTTAYLGIRGEWEGVWDLQFTKDVSVDLIAGLGTRFWIRDIHDGKRADGSYSTAYQETWWTLYPYVGLERRQCLGDGGEMFLSGRIGFTRRHVSRLFSRNVRCDGNAGILDAALPAARDHRPGEMRNCLRAFQHGGVF